jgi:5-methylcytosine-specific restriction endonuclease McrA
MARRRERLAREQDGICPECALPLPGDLALAEVDHIIPRVRGGPDVPWNRQLVHFKCNRTKRFRLTDAAVALAAEHGVRTHLPIPRSAHANRPLTRDESLQRDWWSAISEDRYRSISERLAG